MPNPYRRSPIRTATVAFASLVCMAAASPTTRSVTGSVRRQDDESAVARTKVTIDGGGSTVTSDSGQFAFPLSPPLKVGFPATFHVAGWVITDPCVLARGRVYLPAPEAETISIKVLRRGDPKLKSGNSIGCLLLQQASRFEPKSGLAGGHPAQVPGARLGARNEQPQHYMPWRHAGAPGGGARLPIVEAAYRLAGTTSGPTPSADPRSEAAGAPQVANEFIASQARDLGFAAKQLTSAIAEWASRGWAQERGPLWAV